MRGALRNSSSHLAPSCMRTSARLRGRQQQPATQQGGVGAVELRTLIGIGVVDLLQLIVAGIQPHPGHAIGYEHGAREEQQHQNDTGANFQIDKHEISER
ncbi:hypothetical protein G6F55_014424 [Rhizopus delemar]|nr:hypothetical protein G6F55_014424 [Rhizopus delemar]